MADNAFIRIDDWVRAQELADRLSPDRLHRTLDRYAQQCCPVSAVFGQSYHWSLMQVEYATDLAFRSTVTLGPLYEQLVRQPVLSVKAEQIASFLGRQITPLLTQEIGSQFSTRIEGTCMGQVEDACRKWSQAVRGTAAGWRPRRLPFLDGGSHFLSY